MNLELDVEKLREEFDAKNIGTPYEYWLEVELAYARAEIEIHKQHDLRVIGILKSELQIREAELKGEL